MFDRSRYAKWMFLLLIVLAAASLPVAAQVIVGINPSAVAAGGPGFTLTVTGSGFNVNSTVQIKGSNRTTAFVSALQLTASILASDITTPGSSAITVTNPSVGGGTVSNALQLDITGAPAPTLTSASPEFTTQSASSVMMTLIGSNFRPGATVVISPPLPSLNNSTGHTPASDIMVQSVTLVNSNVITALISASPKAAAGLRAVDVLNLDGTSTAPTAVPGTTKPLQVESSASLGAPLAVANIALVHPRDGTVVMQGA